MPDMPERYQCFAELVGGEVLSMRETGFRVKGTRHMLAVMMDSFTAVLYICVSGRAYREPWHAKFKLVHLAAVAQMACEDLGFLSTDTPKR